MRGYTQLIDFMQDLGDGILDHLPEEHRVAILSVEDIVELWMQRKSYLQALSLKKDIGPTQSLMRQAITLLISFSMTLICALSRKDLVVRITFFSPVSLI